MSVGHLAILLFVYLFANCKSQEPPLVELNQPFTVAIKDNNNYICNGAIVDIYKILTTASCVYHFVSNNATEASYINLTVVAGTPSLSGIGTVYRINAIKVHDYYTHGEMANNLAVLNLTTEIVETDTVKKIGIAGADVVNNSPGALTGWGSESGAAVEDKLHAFDKTIITSAECNAQYFAADTNKVNANEFCGITKGTAGYCSNHGGGLLIVMEELIGLLSWGKFDCTDKSRSVDVYINLFLFTDFIENTYKI